MKGTIKHIKSMIIWSIWFNLSPKFATYGLLRVSTAGMTKKGKEEIDSICNWLVHWWVLYLNIFKPVILKIRAKTMSFRHNTKNIETVS